MTCTSDAPIHGTLYAYTHHGCRCPEARTARARFALKYRRPRRAPAKLRLVAPAPCDIDPETPLRTDWRKHAACAGVDPDLFFPEIGQPATEAKAVCAGCRVRRECLDYALAKPETMGVWGGLSAKQRKRLRVAEAVAS